MATGRTARPTTPLSTGRVLEAGLRIGLPDLSVSAVAQELGVSRAAIHQHVSGRRALQELVGEHLLTGLAVPEDSGQSLDGLLLDLARALRRFCLRVPGMAEYLGTRFPRSESSARVLEDICALLVARGHTPATALRMEAAVSTHAIALVRAEIESVRFMSEDLEGFHSYVGRIEHTFSELPILGEAWPQVRGQDFESHFDWSMRCLVVGVVNVLAADG